MGTIYVFLADGFEEIEALATVDVLRRAELQVKTVSIYARDIVTGAHRVPVKADLLFEGQSFSDADMFVLPGGMPGAANLDAHEGLRAEIQKMADAGKPLAAICAAPMVYGRMGLLKGRKVTCYPSFETHLEGADYTAAMVEKDANFITGKGPAAAISFALAIVELFCGKEKVEALKAGMLLK